MAEVTLDATVGEVKDGRRVLAVTIDASGTRYKLDDKHDFRFVSEDRREAVFECSYCQRRIAFVLPGLGTPAVLGGVGNRALPADYMKYTDPCST